MIFTTRLSTSIAKIIANNTDVNSGSSFKGFDVLPLSPTNSMPLTCCKLSSPFPWRFGENLLSLLLRAGCRDTSSPFSSPKMLWCKRVASCSLLFFCFFFLLMSSAVKIQLPSSFCSMATQYLSLPYGRPPLRWYSVRHSPSSPKVPSHRASGPSVLPMNVGV